jgi:hypothetical protein
LCGYLAPIAVRIGVVRHFFNTAFANNAFGNSAFGENPLILATPSNRAIELTVQWYSANAQNSFPS